MKSGLYTIIEFDKDDKWFVISEIVYNNEVYNYLIRVTADESDFIEDFMVVKCIKNGEDEYFDTVTDKALLKVIIPRLVEGTEALVNNPEKFLRELNKN